MGDEMIRDSIGECCCCCCSVEHSITSGATSELVADELLLITFLFDVAFLAVMKSSRDQVSNASMATRRVSACFACSVQTTSTYLLFFHNYVMKIY